jgi:hypothetical protein
MTQGAGRPTEGARYVVERAEADATRVIYRGTAHLPDADLPLEVTVALPSGATSASLPGAPPELEKAAAALIRAATKSAVASGAALPRKIVRWRG